MPATKPLATNPQTQTTRRTRFGLNVAVALLAAAAVAVLINFLVVLAREQQGWNVRLDLTATRRHSLSAQTTRVLGNLDQDHRIVTLIARGGLSAEQARLVGQVTDLVDEYAARSPRITAQHIAAGLDLPRHEAFLHEIADRFAEQIQAPRQTIERIGPSLTRLRQRMVGPQAQALNEALAAAAAPDELQQLLTTVRRALTSQAPALEEIERAIAESLHQPLPPYAALRGELESALGSLTDRLYRPAGDQLRQWAGRETLAAPLRDAALRLADDYAATADELDRLVSDLRAVAVPEDYQQLATDLSRSDVLAIVGPRKVRVLSVSEMYRQPPPDTADPTAAEYRFVGEPLITGALIGMNMAKAPMVVFVYSGRTPALGPGGQCNHVADVLRRLDFDVRQWSPAPASPGGFGQARPTPAPEPEQGQPAVWVLLPAEQAGPMDLAAVPARDQVVELLKKRLAAGNAAMVMLAANPAAAFQPDPVVSLLGDWGVSALLDRIVVFERALPDRQSRTLTQHIVSTWPPASPLAEALAGTRALFAWAAPLRPIAAAASDDDAGADRPPTFIPLVTVSQPQMWSAPVDSADVLMDARYDPAQAPPDGGFTIAAALERDGQRLVVVADALWAHDQVTTYGEIPGLGGGAGLADMVGASFPGNAELFTNSVFWLMGLDELIAATPRTQDIRRVQAMTPAAMTAARWTLLAGMPALSFAIGLLVWQSRRRG